MGEEVWVLENGEKRHVRFTALDLMFLKAENALERMFGYDPTAAEIFLYTAEKRDKGYSYDELISRCPYKESVESALDKLEDAGILTRGWVKDDNYWERRFFNRGEISKPFQNISKRMKPIELVEKLVNMDKGIKPAELYKKLISIKGIPREVENKLINYFAHIGEILDPHYLIIEGSLDRISYEKLWEKMHELKEEIKAGGVYEADTIIAYHPSRKKMGIYDIPVNNNSMKIPERKMRFVFFLNGGGEARKFQMVPVIGPKIPCITECSYDYDNKFCDKDFEEYRKAYGEGEVCKDCILFNITANSLPEFLNQVDEKFNVKINKCFWEYMSRKYWDTDIGNENKIRDILIEESPELEKLFRDAELKIQEPYGEFKPPKFLHEEIESVEKEIKEFMGRIGDYAEKNGYKVLVVPTRKGYELVKHEIGGKTIEERLGEKGVKVISDEELKWKLKVEELRDAENLGELRKIIIVDDAIDEGKYVKGVVRDIYKILGEEKFGEMDIKIGAYIVNKDYIGRLKEELMKEYGKDFVYEDFLAILK